MASESTPATVNGNYGYKDSYGTTENSLPMAANSATTTNGATGGHSNTASSSNEASTATDTNGSVSKDEVGWYFVEQYYTTLSRNPEKLHVSSQIVFSSGQRCVKDAKMANIILALLLQALPVRLWCRSREGICIGRSTRKCSILATSHGQTAD